MAHGGGGRFSQQLIEEVFLSVFGNDYLNPLNDSAVLTLPNNRLAFTTDSFTVEPIFFPGGDIGRLAVCGTVNDLSMVGAKPLYLSAGFILEEGFPIADLKRIVQSVKEAADEAGIQIVTGDTKVVQKGHADGVFINTSGIGAFPKEVEAAYGRAHAGDRIIVSGPQGAHGMAVMTSREGFGFKSRILSDVAPLNHLVAGMLEVTDQIHVMRDATRGGLATVLNEIASQAGVAVELIESDVPISESVKGACELLGFDPFYVANEGVLVACVAADVAEAVVSKMRETKYGDQSTIIGTVVEAPAGRVILHTQIGSRRIMDLLSGEQLPRIC